MGKTQYLLFGGKSAVTVGNRILDSARTLFDLDRKVLVLTDSGVPGIYVKKAAAQCKNAFVFTVEQGEKSKCMEKYTEIISFMLENGFDRHDCVMAVGGGVCGDLAGFTAATYMRGIDFYNVPTTFLAQADASLGGKNALNFAGCKNVIGSFYQPKGVIADTDVLKTLDERQFACGAVEAVKMFAVLDGGAFASAEKCDMHRDTEKIICRAVEIKKSVVEKDEKESGLRRVLNFGHTVGHGIESVFQTEKNTFLHGECVGMGMLCMSGGEARKRIKAMLEKLGCPTSCRISAEKLKNAIIHDKKSSGNSISVIMTDRTGSYCEKKMTADEIVAKSGEVLTLI